MPQPSFPKTLLPTEWANEEKALLKAVKGYKAATALGTALKDLKAAADDLDRLDCFDPGRAARASDAAEQLKTLRGPGTAAVKSLASAVAAVLKHAKAWSGSWKDEKAAKDGAAAVRLIQRDAEALLTAWQALSVNAAVALEKRADGGGSGTVAIDKLPQFKPVRAKVAAGLKAVRKPSEPGAQPVQFVMCVGAKIAMPYIAKVVSPSHKSLVLPLLGDDAEGAKFAAGQLLWERNMYTFVSEKAAGGMARKLQAGLQLLTRAKLKVCVRRPDGPGEELDGDGDFAMPDAEPLTHGELVARQQSMADGILAFKAVGASALKEAMDQLLARLNTALAGQALEDADDILDQIDALIVGVSQGPAAFDTGEAAPPEMPLQEPTRGTGATPVPPTKEQVEAAQVVEATRRKSLQERETIKKAMDGEAAKPRPDMDRLRKLAEAEFKRAADLDKVLKQASDDQLPIAPPPARVSFDDNTSPGASEWTLLVCAEAYRRYGWFEFKALRKSAQPVKVPGLATQTTITDDVMWKLYQYRRRYVDQLIATLQKKYANSGLLFKSSGSEDIESDLDITVASPGGVDDVKAMRDFNGAIKAKFGRAPGRVFDTNLYARDYRAIKDNLTNPADRSKPAPQDSDIASPKGDMAHMSAIDQDVATLMKQRRFLDAEAFTDLWQTLVAGIADAGEKRRIQQRFEEGEAAYLRTALKKVEAIISKVKAARAGVPEQRRVEFEAAYAKFETQLRIVLDAKEGGHLRALQREMPVLLDLLEQEFPDEVMEVTDDQYAERMGKLRQCQMDLAKLENLLATHTRQGPDCDTVHPGKTHEEWAAELPGGIEALKARIKQDQFTNIVFANEAYMSEGAITHVVAGIQARTPEEKAAVLQRITPAELLQSTNEQVADFFKDMKHMQHEVHAAPDDKKLEVTGEAYVHASKYLSRMLDGAAMLEEKYKDLPDVVQALREPPYRLCVTSKLGPRELQTRVDGWLVKLRKSATVPGPAKALLAREEVNALFGVGDIAGLQQAISNFCIEFNQRVRLLQDFRQSQDDAERAFQQYFRPASLKDGGSRTEAMPDGRPSR
jgi:hypothetical protein